MKLYTRWAKREYPLAVRLLFTLPAGILFVYLIPLMLIRLGPRLDSALHLPHLFFGIPNLVVGGLFMLTGAFYAQWSIVSQFSQADGTPLPVMATQKLLIGGPFKQCRNPMSFGTIALYLGITILVGSLSSLAIVILLASLLIFYLKRVEERELEARFGQEYLDYKARTPFIIPRMNGRR